MLRLLRTPAIRAARPAAIGVRCLSTQPEPKAKASSIIESLPGNSPLTKTGILATASAAAIYAISNELYVLNDETILLCTFSAFVGVIAKILAPTYKEWADSRIKHVSDILNSSRTKHVESVKQRIESVSELKNVVDTTKVLFEVSKETAQLEADAFALKQQVDLAHEAKSVLDSWVRYENGVRQLEQQQLVQAVIKKVESELSNAKFQEKVLQQAVADVERVFANAK